MENWHVIVLLICDANCKCDPINCKLLSMFCHQFQIKIHQSYEFDRNSNNYHASKIALNFGLARYIFICDTSRTQNGPFIFVGFDRMKKFRALVASEWTWSCELWDRVERLDSIGGGRWMLLSIEEGQREAQGAEGRGRRVNENGTIAPLSRLSCRNNTVSVHQYQYSLSPPSPSPNSILFLALGN